jgi:hypothetical protein
LPDPITGEVLLQVGQLALVGTVFFSLAHDSMLSQGT